jgi:hypothetical protein
MLLPSMSTEEIRRRVREAEALLRVAAQHARDAHADPSQSERTSARIQSICREVEALFPGMHEPASPGPEIQEALAHLKVEEAPAAADEANEENETPAADGDDEDEDDAAAEEEPEWDVDYAKLGAAIENEQLMSRFPEPQRSAFKRAAKYLVESHERQVLFSRVIVAFDALSQLTAQNVEETRRKLAMAMTLEELASKQKA